MQPNPEVQYKVTLTKASFARLSLLILSIKMFGSPLKILQDKELCVFNIEETISHTSEKVKTFQSPELKKTEQKQNKIPFICSFDTLAEITPVTCLLQSVSPICCISPACLTSQLLSAVRLSDKLHPRTR